MNQAKRPVPLAKGAGRGNRDCVGASLAPIGSTPEACLQQGAEHETALRAAMERALIRRVAAQRDRAALETVTVVHVVDVARRPDEIADDIERGGST